MTHISLLKTRYIPYSDKKLIYHAIYFFSRYKTIQREDKRKIF